MARFVNVDRTTTLLLPPDLRDWVKADDVVHLVIEAVEQMDFARGLAAVNAEWSLLCTAFNLRRLHRLMAKPA